MRIVLTPLFAILLLTSTLSAREQRRPCGPGSRRNLIRLFIPQGVLGADFKPACRQHDSEYGTPGTNKAESDLAFYNRITCACENSATPRLCRWITRIMYSAVSGPLSDRSFQRGQTGN